MALSFGEAFFLNNLSVFLSRLAGRVFFKNLISSSCPASELIILGSLFLEKVHHIAVHLLLNLRVYILLLSLSFITWLKHFNALLTVRPEVFEITICLEGSMGQLKLLFVVALINPVVIYLVDIVGLDVSRCDGLRLARSFLLQRVHTAFLVQHFGDIFKILGSHFGSVLRLHFF